MGCGLFCSVHQVIFAPHVMIRAQPVGLHVYVDIFYLVCSKDVSYHVQASSLFCRKKTPPPRSALSHADDLDFRHIDASCCRQGGFERGLHSIDVVRPLLQSHVEGHDGSNPLAVRASKTSIAVASQLRYRICQRKCVGRTRQLHTWNGTVAVLSTRCTGRRQRLACIGLISSHFAFCRIDSAGHGTI